MMTKKIANKILISGIITLIALRAFAVCSVNADLSCSDPLINGRPAYSGIKWIFRSPYEKALLYGTTDVQNSRVSCIRFAQLMKTECGISDPVQFIFKSDADQISTSGYVTAPQPNLSELSDLDSSFKKYFSGVLGVNVNKNLQDKTAQILNTEQMNLLNQFADPKSNSSRLEINMSCRAGESSSVNNLGCIYTVKCEALGAGGVGEKLIITKKPNVSSFYFCTKSNATNILMAIVQSANQNKDLSLPIPQSNFTTFENMPMISVNNSSLSSLLYTKWRISKYEWSELRLPASMAMMGDGLMPPLASAIDVPIDSIITAASVAPPSSTTTTTVPTTTTTSTTSTTTTTIPKPAITKQPNPTYFVASGGVLQLSVEASGLNLKYQWYKDNSLIANASANAYQIAPGAAGVYRVRVSNSSGYVDSNSAMVIIASPCYFGANKVEHGSSVFAYAKPTSENCENEKQSRTCNNGVLSGNNFYPSCQQIKNCTYNGQTVGHGGTVDVYSSAVATVCVKVKRGCNNGVINLAATDVPTCREYKSCSFAGAVIPHGQSVVAYANDVSGDCSKESQRRICDDGVLQGSYSKTNCRQGRTCNFVAQDDGTAVTLGVFHGSTVKAYRVSMSQNCESEMQKRQCTDGVLDGTYTQATCHAPRSCNFNGAVVAHNNMVTAYANAVSSNCAGESEKRVCIDGKLSGSKNQSSCREPKSCTFAGDIVPHGQSVIAYGNSGSKNCESEKEKRVCNDGVLSGYSSYKTCTESKSCAYNGQTIAHGASLEVYSEAVSANCVKVKRICNNGVITFQATDSLTCTVPTTTTSTTTTTTTTTLATKSCTFNGNKVAHNTSVKAYLNTVSNSCEREVENRLCVNGVLQGSYTQSSCRQFRSCDFAGTTVAHGGSITAYLNPVSANCVGERETRTCDDGVLRGSYTQTKCQAPGDCEFNGQMIASGKVVTAYKNAVSSSCNTERQLRLCSNGVLRGTYQYDSCRER